MKQNIIIVAGGKGLRIGGELPKQFIPIGGKPILMHTIEAFYNYNKNIHIVLVLPASHRDYWAGLCVEYNFTIPHVITLGGETRFHSVKNGLDLITDGIVGVHDGARPFVSVNLIKNCYESAKELGAVIPVINPIDSLRQITEGGNSHIVDRSKIRAVQTPQIFNVDVLKKAYETDFSPQFTDDASVVESSGVKVHLIDGEVTNIKVTTPFDLQIAELLVNKK